MSLTGILARRRGSSPPPPPPPGPWTPAQLNGVTLDFWLDAQAAGSIVQSAGLVSQWNDRAGNGRFASASGSLRPSYSASALNGLPGVIFDGAEDRLELSSVAGFPTGTDAGGIIAVARLDAPGFYPQLLNYGKASPGKTRGLASAGSAREVGVTWYANDPNTGVAWSDPRIVIAEFAASQAAIYIDGGAAIVLSAGGSPVLDATGNSGQIGAAFGAGLGPYTVQELLCVNGALAAVERHKLEGYLAHKWSLAASLPAGHPFKAAPPP